MKTSRFFPVSSILLLGLSLFSCGKNHNGNEEGFPSDFKKYSDEKKVAYVIKHATPDSVARFVIDATLGRIGDIRIDSIGRAAAHAYASYNDSALLVYSVEFDEYSQSLPLPDKMKVYVAAGKSVPQQLGYQLGLEYVSQIRMGHKSVEEIKSEMKEFEKACGEDTLTYTRFLKGFQTALDVDHGQDLPEAVYKAFSAK